MKLNYNDLLNNIVKTGCDFADIYYEKTKTKIYSLVDSKIDMIKAKYGEGVGIRSSLNEKTKYTATNDLSVENINFLVKQHQDCYSGNNAFKEFNMEMESIKDINPIKIKHDDFASDKKIEILHKIDEIARNYSKLVSQVKASFIEEDKDFTVTSTRGFIKSASYTNTRLLISVYVTDGDKKEQAFDRVGSGKGYEFLEDIDIEDMTKKVCDTAINNLNAKTIKGGNYPVILPNGFGAVIFHEACGHGLEATGVAPKTSCFTGLLGQKIASDKVTLIDDGSIKNAWGSVSMDDEGTISQKNILIDKGKLSSYMVDYINQKKMDNHPLTGSGRRQNYLYEPTSRMTNTYIASGNDKIEDMIKSIDYGIYCHHLGGGLVDTASGNFNFDVQSATLIENGHLTVPLKGLCLIGTGKDILNKVEMVSDDLNLSDGYCGSVSGTIFVTIGQPTIKISSMQVGGKDE